MQTFAPLKYTNPSNREKRLEFKANVEYLTRRRRSKPGWAFHKRRPGIKESTLWAAETRTALIANSQFSSRRRSSTRDFIAGYNSENLGRFWLMFVFQAKRESC